MGLSDKKSVALFQVSEISAGWDFKNLILAKHCCRIVTLTA